MTKKNFLPAAMAILFCLVVILALPTDVTVNVDGTLPNYGSGAATAITPAVEATTQAPVAQTTTSAPPATDSAAPSTDDSAPSDGNSTEVKEIIDQYTLLVNKFKKEKPSYKKKEYQELPEEFRNLGTAGNLILRIAAGYITSEDDCEELVRTAGSEDILWDMPIHNSETGCLLTNYDAVEWAKCEDVGDGTKKISFSLKEEMNCEPTPADTLIPVSNHGAVMQPLSRNEILKEVEKITSTVPGLALNDFSLGYRECLFECVYNPETDQVLSITHHVVIDITADIKVAIATIDGSARLYNDMRIYDITW